MSVWAIEIVETSGSASAVVSPSVDSIWSMCSIGSVGSVSPMRGGDGLRGASGNCGAGFAPASGPASASACAGVGREGIIDEDEDVSGREMGRARSAGDVSP